MSTNQRIVILGGHGKVALLTAARLAAAGYAVDSVIRNPDHWADVEATGASPVVLDIERAGVNDLAELFAGSTAVVFSAGAGGGSPERTRAVDYEAAIRAMQGAESSGVQRFVLVSYATTTADLERVDPSDSFYPYLKAKADADAALRQTGLDYTILGPGGLTEEPATGRIRITDPFTDEVEGRERAEEDGKITSRDNVAAVITHVIAHRTAVRDTVNFYDGPTPIALAIG